MAEKSLKAFIVGLGSIGQRHLKNLKQLGVEDFLVFDPNPESNSKQPNEIRCSGITEGLQKRPDFVVLTSPTHLHLEQASLVAQAGIPFFLEKPLAHNSNYHSLLEEVRTRQTISMVGCNMRFHPGPKKMREWVQLNKIGRVLYGKFHSGSYLPHWRKGVNFRDTYSTQVAQGGGCILDNIHEIDLAHWILGEIETTQCLTNTLNSLGIEPEEVALLQCRHRSGTLTSIVLDYVSRSYERGIHLCGETGTLHWDFNLNKVGWYSGEKSQWIYEMINDWELNQMYLDEMKYFLDCVRNQKHTFYPVSEAAKVLRVALTAKGLPESETALHHRYESLPISSP